MFCHAQYKIVYHFKDSAALQKKIVLKDQFPSQLAATSYINTLPKQLQALGFMAASVDSLAYEKDSLEAFLYTGNVFSFTSIKPNAKAQKYLELASIHWQQKPSPIELQQACEKMLGYFENNGHPFAYIVLDSISWKNNDLHAIMKIEEAAPYKIDSIHTIGSVNLNQHYLQHYLGVGNKSPYNKTSLNQISNRLRELPFLRESQPWKMDMLSTGGTVDLFLEPKRSSQINVLVGFAPNTNALGQSKLLFTGQATVNLKNALGAGETIGVDWQQLQSQSPRLTLAFQYPYIFNSPYGLDAGFELYKKDSQYVNINSHIGVVYELNAQQSGKVMLLTSQTNVGFTDTTKILSTKTLDSIIDVSSVSLGVSYQFNNTNYRLNPRRGWDIQFEGSVGTRNIKKNTDILNLKDPSDPSFNFASLYDSIKLTSYQFRVRTSISHYFPLGRLTILKTALQSGWYQSPNIFLNEMFQIGGTKILRGFNEESIYANLYNVFTAELRYLIGSNSYFFTFGDGGFTHYQQQSASFSHNYLGVGVGLAFETGSSVFNISLAVGKSDAVPFDLQQAKIHLGFLNYF
jgi:outer membrane protein assembly factor BamA